MYVDIRYIVNLNYFYCSLNNIKLSTDAAGGNIMAIVKCLECGGKISTDSKSCPHCGATKLSSIGRPSEMIALTRIIGVILIIVGIWMTYDFYQKFLGSEPLILVLIGIVLLFLKMNHRVNKI
jgi:hypothetical protein